jgi:hypothetical protein
LDATREVLDVYGMAEALDSADKVHMELSAVISETQ